MLVELLSSAFGSASGDDGGMDTGARMSPTPSEVRLKAHTAPAH